MSKPVRAWLGRGIPTGIPQSRRWAKPARKDPLGETGINRRQPGSARPSQRALRPLSKRLRLKNSHECLEEPNPDNTLHLLLVAQTKPFTNNCNHGTMIKHKTIVLSPAGTPARIVPLQSKLGFSDHGPLRPLPPD